MEQSLFKFQWRIGNNFLCSRSLPLAFAHFGCVFSRSPLFGRTMLFLLISNFSQKFHFNLYLFDFFSSWLLNVEFFFFGVCVCWSSYAKLKIESNRDHCWFARNDLSLIMCLMCVYPLHGFGPLSIVVGNSRRLYTVFRIVMSNWTYESKPVSTAKEL